MDRYTPCMHYIGNVTLKGYVANLFLLFSVGRLPWPRERSLEDTKGQNLLYYKQISFFPDNVPGWTYTMYLPQSITTTRLIMK